MYSVGTPAKPNDFVRLSHIKPCVFDKVEGERSHSPSLNFVQHGVRIFDFVRPGSAGVFDEVEGSSTYSTLSKNNAVSLSELCSPVNIVQFVLGEAEERSRMTW